MIEIASETQDALLKRLLNHRGEQRTKSNASAMNQNHSCNVTVPVAYPLANRRNSPARLARATVAVLVEVDGYRLGEVLVEVACFLLCEGLARDNCGALLVEIGNHIVGASYPRTPVQR